MLLAQEQIGEGAWFYQQPFPCKHGAPSQRLERNENENKPLFDAHHSGHVE